MPTDKPKSTPATQEWEKEGGATPAVVPALGIAAVFTPVVVEAVPPHEIAVVEAKQDEIMAVKSSDGASPSRGWRLTGWLWLAIVVPALFLVGGLIWVALAAGIGLALAGLVLVLVMVGAAAPMWGAGLFRGSEEREAKVEAEVAVREGH